jgi:hypothetical protein
MVVEEAHLEVLSALWQLVGGKLLSQLWNGFERLSFDLHHSMDLMAMRVSQLESFV